MSDFAMLHEDLHKVLPACVMLHEIFMSPCGMMHKVYVSQQYVTWSFMSACSMLYGV